MAPMNAHNLVFGSIDWEEYINSSEKSADPVRIETKDSPYSYNSIPNAGKKLTEQIHHPNYLGSRIPEQPFRNHVKGMSVHEYPLLRVKNPLHVKNGSQPLLCPQLVYKYIVPKEMKLAIQNLLQFVCDMHLNGKCLSDFDEDNLVVTRNDFWEWDEDSRTMVQKKSVMFCNVDFVKFTLEGRRKDMNCLHGIISRLFAQSSKPMPDDIKHFLALLIADVKENEWKSMGFYLTHHLAILPIKDRMLFMKNISEKKFFITNKTITNCYEKAVKNFSYNLDPSWEKRFENDALGPMKSCFYRENDKNISIKDDGSWTNGSWTNPPMLRQIRNLTQHLPSYIALYKGYDTSNGVPFNDGFRMDEEVDACMMYLFCKELLQFQSELYNQNILEEIHQ